MVINATFEFHYKIPNIFKALEVIKDSIAQNVGLMNPL